MTNMFDLSGKVAIAVGGASGISKAIALGFSEAGADVVLADLNKEGMDDVAKEIEAKGKRVLTVQTDVTSEEDVENMALQAKQTFGHVDVLIAGAGITVRKPTLELSKEEFEYVIGVNLTGVFLCGKAVGRLMVAQGSGSIINVASIMGHVSLPGRPAYDASKGGVVQLTKAMALEWAENNVRVNALCPGFTRTALTEPLWEDPERLAMIEGRTPMKRLAEPEEMVGAAVFLASDASLFVTGTSLFVDGGWMAW